MTDTEILAIVLREMEAYGNGWRLSWAGFDGRMLRTQLSGIAKWAVSAQAGDTEPDYRQGSEFLESQATW